MPTIKTSGDLITSISADMADNNAGLISAEDVRHNMEDTVISINSIVASGDTDVVYPFFNDVRAKKTASAGGTFIAESGITFPNSPISTDRQVEPFLGVGNLLHNSLGGLTLADPHSQYVSNSGHRPMTGNLSVGNNWVGASGNDDMGFKFVPNADGTEDIYTSGVITFGDNSIIDNTAKGVARAWCQFDASGVGNVPVVRSWYNIESIQRLDQGKLKITISSGVFDSNSYVAIGTSNATTASGSMEDFSVNSVGLVLREGNAGADDGTTKRTVTYVVKNENGDYVDSEMCDFVAYGYRPTETSGTAPTMIGL